MCLSVSGEGVQGRGGGRREEDGDVLPSGTGTCWLHRKEREKRDRKKVAKRCGAINMTQAAAKEVLKGLEEENRVGSLMGWTTNKEQEKKCSRFFFFQCCSRVTFELAETAARSWERGGERRGIRPAEWRAAAVGNWVR